MNWLVFVFFCAVTARSFVYNSNGDAVHEKFCKKAVHADWTAPREVDLIMRTDMIDPVFKMKKTFSFDSADKARAFITGVQEFCAEVAGKEITASIGPLDAAGVEKEYPMAFFSRHAGDQVFIDLYHHSNGGGLAEHSVWSRMVVEEVEEDQEKDDDNFPCDEGCVLDPFFGEPACNCWDSCLNGNCAPTDIECVDGVPCTEDNPCFDVEGEQIH